MVNYPQINLNFIIFHCLSLGFIVCDDSELCDKIISQDVENEQRRRNLAKSFVIICLKKTKIHIFYSIILIGNQLMLKKLIY